MLHLAHASDNLTATELPAMSPAPSSRRAAQRGPVSPTKRVARLAREASRRLSPYAEGDLRIRVSGEQRDDIELPATAVRLLADLLNYLADGSAVSIMPTRAELTTHQAAHLLGVSRPYLIRVLETGTLPFRLVGTHRRIRLADLIAYRDTMDARRQAALDKLTRQAQELGMGY
ncbi:MAG: hypothetical protein HBSAPP03_02780 [Phycisphaerae bacterium]|nr:MAG: hypothetical protein HBSAPP03_02780 [Phycisphaerae bacterium]